MFLYDRVELSKAYNSYEEVPKCVLDNLNPEMKIRPYQEHAFRNYVTYFENPNLRIVGNRTLFHMATGSGKTLIMAGLIIYLYQKGYRNFLFFVPLSNIKSKTIENLTVPSSPKYLFADSIVIDGNPVRIRQVNSFVDSTDDAINICFTTVQQIHHNYWDVRENGITAEDFQDRKIVFISDEAHHLTVDTAKKLNKEEETESKSWEYVIKSLYKANHENVMIEFTATCNLDNPNIHAEYENKIIFNYDLKQFRRDRYSKEVQTLQSDLDFMGMSLQAMVISQYRLHLFNDLHQDIKPVILFKSSKIADSEDFVSQFERTVGSLRGSDLEPLTEVKVSIVQRAFRYFESKGISLELLAKELKEGFSPHNIIAINNESSIRSNDKLLNSLESKNNPIRAIFEVKALDEGWDVLNLFDIVRLYDTRDAKNGVPGRTTIQEAQLIGRGARYCPFILNDPKERYVRKFDKDLDSEYRICEEMLYHCHTNSKYIDELHKALVETGIMDSNMMSRSLDLKKEFKESNLYRHGVVLVNEQIELDKLTFDSLPEDIRERTYQYKSPSKSASIITIMDMMEISKSSEKSKTFGFTVKQIADMNYNLVHSALRRYPRFNFSELKKTYPDLLSMKEFITSDNYLGGIHIDITTAEEQPAMEDLHKACIQMANQVSEAIGSMKRSCIGSHNFKSIPFKDLFFDKLVNYSDPNGEGLGTPQSESHEWRLDLSDKKWYAFSENYGTGEEKGFVKYFSEHVHSLESTYDMIYLVRNERHMHIFSFDEGRRFEPDYLLFLGKNGEPAHQLQIFIEPKGSNLMETDAWKERFLLEIETVGSPDSSIISKDVEYFLKGMPFYNNLNRKQFDESFNELPALSSKWQS